MTIILLCLLPVTILCGFLVGRYSTLKHRVALVAERQHLKGEVSRNEKIILSNEKMLASYQEVEDNLVKLVAAYKSVIDAQNNQIDSDKKVEESLITVITAQKDLILHLCPEYDAMMAKINKSFN